jgi:large subunit ribosomal protein L18
MTNQKKVLALRVARKTRVRQHMEGTAQKPRVSIYRSNRYILMQAIDDVNGVTITGLRDSASKATKTERATATAKAFAEVLKKNKIIEVIFDRGPYKYHGRIKAIAEALREAGIKV